jgi:dTDP-4-dehydrorhamnose reductase
MRLLIIGRTGQLARALCAAASRQGEYDVACLGRADIDMDAPEAVRDQAIAAMPDAIVNAAAYTSVDLAETEPDKAFAANQRLPAALAGAASALNIPFIHVSTDYVFSGDKLAAYREDDETDPRSVYGASKLAGEQAVRALRPDSIILRTAWVYDSLGRNFVRTMLRLARSRAEISVVDDQIGCPTYAPDLADGILRVLRHGASNTQEGAGVFHMTGAGETTWCGFARTIFEISGEHGGPTAQVRQIATSDYPTPAHRPANSRLDGSRLFSVYGVALPHWRDGLERCLTGIAATRWSLE